MTSVLGKRLKEARLRLELTQAQVGLRAGFDPSGAGTRINQYERGRHVPQFAVCEQLARAVEVPTPYLYAADDQLAAWILAYAEIGTSKRRVILEKAGVRKP